MAASATCSAVRFWDTARRRLARLLNRGRKLLWLSRQCGRFLSGVDGARIPALAHEVSSHLLLGKSSHSQRQPIGCPPRPYDTSTRVPERPESIAACTVAHMARPARAFNMVSPSVSIA